MPLKTFIRILGLVACILVINSAAAQVGPSTTPDWAKVGSNFGTFGQVVATAGDVNGDGFSDVIVIGTLNEDAVVYYGSASGLSDSVAWAVDGSSFGESRFSTAATAGDVNGDGYDDVIVAAEGHLSFGTIGRVLVFHGSNSGLSTSPDFNIAGLDAREFFGHSVATAGDVNGDGYDDVLVSATEHFFGAERSGRVHLYLGSANGLLPTPLTRIGVDPFELFGLSVSTAGDINGDGFDDVIVGSGRAIYLFLGGTDPLAAAPQRILGGSDSAGTAGDVNGDGYSDVIVGKSNHAEIYLGSESGLSMTPDWSAAGMGDFGETVATAGDLDGDGFSDVIIGAPAHLEQMGEVYVYLGAGLDLSGGAEVTPEEADWTVTGSQGNSQLGTSVATAGDVNGDGFSDLIVGAPRFVRETGGQQTSIVGRTLVYHGRGSGPAGWPTAGHSQADWTVGGQSQWPANEALGTSVTTAGDVNADGYSDVIVGAPGFDGDLGRALLFLGSASGLFGGSEAVPDDADLPILGEVPGGRFGSLVAAAEDVNGDGYGDVIVDGKLYLGGSAPLLRTEAGFDIGGSLYRPAGDVNGDGFSDVIVYGETVEEGTLYLGSDTALSTDPAWEPIRGAVGACEDSVYFRGLKSSGAVAAGDVNGDGYDDVIAPGFVLYLGSSSGLSSDPVWSEPEWVDYNHPLLGMVRQSHARGVAAGDVNGDGFSDVLAVGSCRMPPLLYLGSESGLSPSPAWAAPVPRDSVGIARNDVTVGPAGDVNGDGFSDLIVGHWASVLDPVSAKLYLGSSTGPSGGLAAAMGDADWTVLYDSGEFPSPRTTAVGTAGDVNGDGFSDFVLGDPILGDDCDFDPNCYDTGGRVFLFLGNNGPGLIRRVQQIQDDLGTDRPIARGGLSESSTAFRIKTAGPNAAGARTVGLEWEVADLGTPLDGSNIQKSAGLCEGGTTPCANNADCNHAAVCRFDTPRACDDGISCTTNADCSGVGTGACRADLAMTVGIPGGVSDPAAFLHWRVRITTKSPFFPHSPWFSIPGNNISEKKLRTPGELQPEGFGLHGPPPNELRFVDSGPMTFSWRTGGATQFRLEWSRNDQFVPPLESMTVTTQDPVWAAYRPDDTLWQTILELAQQTGFQPDPIFWRVVALDGPSPGIGAGQVRALRLGAAVGPHVTIPANGSTIFLPPTIFWTANHNSQFQIRFSANSHIGEPRLVFGGPLPDNYFQLPDFVNDGNFEQPPWCARGAVPFETERACAWKPSDEEWAQVLALVDPDPDDGSRMVHYVVFGRDTLGRTSFGQVQTLRVTATGPRRFELEATEGSGRRPKQGSSGRTRRERR